MTKYFKFSLTKPGIAFMLIKFWLSGNDHLAQKPQNKSMFQKKAVLKEKVKMEILLLGNKLG